MFRIEKMISLAIALVLGTNARGQTPVGTITGIPPPDFHAASTTLRYDSSGDLYAWDGLSVWKQTGGTGSFSNIGSVAAGNSADAGPISFSQDGNTLLLSNGAGGTLGGSFNGKFFTMPATGGTDMQVSGSVPYAYDALALPAASTLPGSSTKYVVYQGSSSYSELGFRFRLRDRRATNPSSTTGPARRLRLQSTRQPTASTSACTLSRR